MRIALLLLIPAVFAADPAPTARAVLDNITTDVTELEQPVDRLVTRSAELAADPGRDATLLFLREAEVVDRKADALARKAQRLAELAAELK